MSLNQLSLNQWFPPELSRHVQDFLRPRFVYWREYKEALKELNRAEWPELKEKLMGPNAVQAMDCLRRYIIASKLSSLTHCAYKTPDHVLTEEEENRVRADYYNATYDRLTVLGEILDL
jgi:hypothetical protein